MPENHIPPEIYQLAKTYYLGEPTARYETLPRTIRHYHFSLYTTIIVIWLGLFALLSTLLIFSHASAVVTSLTDLPVVFGWPIFWIVVLWLLIRSNIRTTYQKTVLYLCELGLLGYNEQDKRVTLIPWGKIESVWLQIMPTYIAVSEDEETRYEKQYDWKYTFQRTDGEKFTFEGHFGVLALSYFVDKEVTARLLPKAITTYEAGLPVSFGDIQVSRKGIQIGQEAIAWQNIFSIELEGDQIMVRLPDWEHWIGTPKAATPNVCVLEALIHYIITQEKHPVAISAHPDPIFFTRHHSLRKRRHHRHKP